MTPEQVAASYDQIADQWLDVSTYGFAQIERAVAFVTHKGVALDVGCGAGRCLGLLTRHGFRTDGIDPSTCDDRPRSGPPPGGPPVPRRHRPVGTAPVV